MTESNSKKQADDRAVRRATALRSNLARRKAQARARDAAEDSEGARSNKPEPKNS